MTGQTDLELKSLVCGLQVNKKRTVKEEVSLERVCRMKTESVGQTCKEHQHSWSEEEWSAKDKESGKVKK